MNSSDGGVRDQRGPSLYEPRNRPILFRIPCRNADTVWGEAGKGPTLPGAFSLAQERPSGAVRRPSPVAHILLLAKPSKGRDAMQIRDYESDVRHWLRWFAWYPVLINGQCVWLQTVQRRPVDSEIVGQYWVYRRATER